MAGETELNRDIPDCDIMEILVATDIHLGYNEKDPIRGDDSFIAFEEILKIAKERGVDFILLGGDLFHDNKPTPKCYHRCLKLLRQYCLGDKPIQVEFLSDQAENFQYSDFPVVNYEDPNYSIAIPVFSIHGNHDDPSGQGLISSLDILSVSGLVNYFGKSTNLKNIEISPLLLRKGITYVALYGLSHIKDDRLARLFRDEKVVFFQADEPNKENTQATWFNIFVCHQNRAERGTLKYLPEAAIPNFFDLIIWGHEHECRIEPEHNPVKKFHISQPGSPVATSLSEGEAKPKHVGLLQIYKDHFKLTPIKLRTVRPFVFDNLTLSDHDFDAESEMMSVQESVEKLVKKKVESMIEASKDQLTGYEKQPRKPLIRLRVEWSREDQCFNTIRFGQIYFQDDVANPLDMILLRKEKVDKKKKELVDLDPLLLGDLMEEEAENVQNVLERYFTEVDESKQLKVLSVQGLGEAVSRFVDRGDRDAIKDLTNHQINRTVNYLKTRDITDETIIDEIEEYRLSRLGKGQNEAKEACKILESASRSQLRRNYDNDLNTDNEDDISFDDMEPKVSTSSTRGTRGARGGRATRARGSNSATRGRARGGRRGKADTHMDSTQTSIKTSFGTRASTSQTRTQKKTVYVDELSDSD